MYPESNLNVYFELEIILPLLLSGIVVVAVTVLICVVMHKRQALQTFLPGEQMTNIEVFSNLN